MKELKKEAGSLRKLRESLFQQEYALRGRAVSRGGAAAPGFFSKLVPRGYK